MYMDHGGHIGAFEMVLKCMSFTMNSHKVGLERKNFNKCTYGPEIMFWYEVQLWSVSPEIDFALDIVHSW